MPLIRKTDELTKKDGGDQSKESTVRNQYTCILLCLSSYVCICVCTCGVQTEKGEKEGPSPSKKAKVDDKSKGDS